MNCAECKNYDSYKSVCRKINSRVYYQFAIVCKEYEIIKQLCLSCSKMANSSRACLYQCLDTMPAVLKEHEVIKDLLSGAFKVPEITSCVQYSERIIK